MLNLSKSCQYALRSLIYLARNSDKGYIKITKISAEEKIPTNYLSKILQNLIKQGVVSSLVGPTGGVKLSPRSFNISIASLVESVDGKMSLNDCILFGDKDCFRFKFCPITVECGELMQKTWSKLKKIKLGDFYNANIKVESKKQ